MNKVKQYFMNWMILLDLAGNTLFGGDPQETISSRLGKAVYKHDNKWAYYACRLLSWFDKQHCLGAIDKHAGDKAIWRWK